MLSSSKLVLNSLGTRFVLFTVSVPRKPKCPVMVFEFLRRFFVNLPLGVLQVIVVACFNYKVSGSLLNRFYANFSDKTGVSGFSNRAGQFWQF
jgi:hypothetical protein